MNSSKLQIKIKQVQALALGFVFILIVAVTLMPAKVNAAANWVANPASCPQSDQANFPGQNCAPNNMCGDTSGIAQCYNTASISAPAVSIDSATLYASLVGGGYVINCFATSDAGTPFCDNNGAAWCNRDASCYGGGNNRLTTCLAGHWASEGASAYTCGDCLSTHLDCTGDSKCETQKNVTAYPTGGNNHYGNTCNSADVRCNANYYDCDATGVTVGNGCEAYRSGACIGEGNLTGTWSCVVDAGGTCTDGGSNYTCVCVTPKCPFESATLCQYFSSDPLLWGKQLGSGELIRMGNSSKENAFVVENDGSIRMATTSAPGDTTGLLYNVNGDLYWDGTLIGVGASSSALDFQQVTDLGNITTNWIQFAGGTSTADLGITGNLNVFGDALFVNATGTNIVVAEQFLLGQYAVLPVSGYRPGAMVYNTTDSSPYFWDGAQWIAFATGTGAGGGTLDDAYNFGGAGAGRQIFTLDGSSPVEIVNPGTDQWETSLALTNASNGGGIAFQTMENFGDYGGRLYFTDNTADPENGTGAYMYADNTMEALEFGYQTAGTRNSSFYIAKDQMLLNITGAPTYGALGIMTSSYNVPSLGLIVPGPKLSSQIYMHVGTSTPEGNVTAYSGSLFFRTDGVGVDEQLYVKTTDVGNTGWMALSGTGDLQAVTDVGNITTNWIEFAGGTSTGTIIPSTNNAYSLGNTTNRWSDLWAGVTHIGTSTWDLAQADNGAFTIAQNGGNEAMRILTNGNVGIGVDDPEEMLSVKSNVLIGQFNGILPPNGRSANLILRATDGHNPGIQGSAYTTFQRDGGNIARFGIDEDNNINFDYWNSWNSSWASRMIIDSEGNVGINSDEPQYRLDVNGIIRATSQLVMGRSNLLPHAGVEPGAMLFRSIDSTAHLWDGTRWNKLITYNDLYHTAWNVTGNTGIDPAMHFLGTTDGQPLVFKTNNLESMRLSVDGYLGIGTSTPLALLHAHGADRTSEIRVSSENGENAYLTIDYDRADGGEGGLNLRENGALRGVIRTGFNGYNFLAIDAQSGYDLNLDTSGIPRVHISAKSGRVGIGTISPGTRLHVNSSEASTTAIATYQNNAGSYRQFIVNSDPQGAVTGTRGDLAIDSVNGSLFIKKTGDETTTGWVALADANSNHWQKNSNALSPTDSAVYQISVTNNSASTLTGFRAVNTNDVHNYAGAVLELKGSGADYTNNVYFGKYGANFWVPSWANNGVLATDKSLVIGAVGASSLVRFQVGGGYNAPVSRMTLDSDSLDLLAGVSLNVGGNTVLGDATSDTIAFTGRAVTSLLPATTNLYSLGSTTNRWSDLWAGVTHIGTSTWDLAQANNGALTIARNGGNEAMRILTNGSVGIGTNSPSTLYRLNVHGSSYFSVDEAISAFEIYNAPQDNIHLRVNGDDDYVILQENSGKVGLGTSNPAYKLDVLGDARLSAQFMLGQYALNPASGLRAGAMIYNTASSTPFFWNGTGWKALASQDLITLDKAYDGGGSGAGRQITVDSGPVYLTGAGNGTALQIDYSGSSQGISLSNSGSGTGIVLSQSGTGVGMYMRQNAGIGIQLDNNTANDGLVLLNASTGNGIKVQNSGDEGTGIRIENKTGGNGIYIDDTLGRYGININKPSGVGHLIYLSNQGTGDSLSILHSSTGKAFRLQNTGTGDSLYITDEVGDTTPFVLNSKGSLGIGTANPDSKLQIVEDNSLSKASLLKFQASNSPGIQSEIYFNAGENATYWDVNSSGDGGALIVMNEAVQLARFTHGGLIINDNGDDFVNFRVESNNNTHAFFVESDGGNVGFDQSSPLSKLHIGNTNSGLNADYDYLRLEGWGKIEHRVYSPYGTNLMIWDFNNTGDGGAIEFRNEDTRIGLFTNSGLVINEGGVAGVGLRVEGGTETHLLYTDALRNRVGIGTSAPIARFDVTQYGNTVAVFNRTGNDGTIISLRQDGTEEGTISVSGNTVSYNAFTGSHYAWTNETMEYGMLVSLTGDNRYLHDNTQSEIVYGVSKTAIVNDSKVMGSYLALQEPSQAYDASNPHLIMAVGNGEVWVADKGENINIGNYLISSDVVGHAQKDTGEFIVSHIVAKAAESIDWSNVTSEINGVKHKKISVFFESFDKSNMHSSIAGTSLQGGGSNLEVTDLAVGSAVFEGNVTIMNHVALSRDAVGQALILAGENKVKVSFEMPYDELPIVTVTPYGVRRMDYGVENVSLTGFDIVIDPIQYKDTIFNWHAFGNCEAKVFVSNGTTLDIEMTDMGSSKLESDINSNGQTVAPEQTEEIVEEEIVTDPMDEAIEPEIESADQSEEEIETISDTENDFEADSEIVE